MSLFNRLKRLEGQIEEPPTLSLEEKQRLLELLNMPEGNPNYDVIECMELCYKLNPISFEERLRALFNEGVNS